MKKNIYLFFFLAIISCAPKNAELTTIERLKLPKKLIQKTAGVVDKTPVFAKWHTVTLSFEGPSISESDAYDPFLNYALEVEFKHAKTQKTIRGFYAADGNAGETSAESGNIWQVRFTPEHIGKWSYSAKLVSGYSIALENDLSKGKPISITNSKGNFLVVQTDKAGKDFRNKGRIIAAGKNFRYKNTDRYFLKIGANSPENFLGYHEFDGTYRISAADRDGEAKATKELHKFEPHIKDWKTGDPTWKNGKGKGIIGAVNYLASKGMNSIYFLTMNIGGDGKDVWPYQSPDDFTRFDVSRLEQWEVLFQHMQSKGILLHIVLQETENELMLDGGDTGPMRQLYYRELIARFGHHLGLIWNLGEENGPAHWFPTGQNNRQRIAMAKFFNDNDPYNHPVLLHTHSEKRNRAPILDSLVSTKHYLDGLSFQHHDRKTAPENIYKWLGVASGSYNDWLISMDEIGMWHTGALTDTADVDHPSLRRYVLWGSLMTGAAGVEWYFGAKHVHNDLTSEDWRQRDRLWELTDIAHQFFKKHLPFWKMGQANHLINVEDAYCFATTYKHPIFAIYLPERGNCTLDLNNISGPNISINLEGQYKVSWYDPLKGGDLQKGSVTKISGGGIRDLGLPPKDGEQDWVILIEKI